MYFSYCPTKKIFGDNAVPALAREIGDAGRIALIASASAMNAPGLAEALAPLDARICLRQISHAAGEPDYLAVGALADTLRERQVTLLLCVGGASVIDLAKAAAVCAHFPGNADEKWAQLLASPFDTPALPIAVISSLPGTSSE
ncbi:MAG TPA: iron-containing alcohol dehydrogenase, partial [Azonexus sp.]|nr:iron-containing alcohol dehydrogenase [Azonexus sp.]